MVTRVNIRAGGASGGAWALCLLLAACASSAAPASRASSDLTVRDVGRCVEEAYPPTLPAPAELVDTAALNRAVRELRQSRGLAGQLLLSLGFQADGRNMRRDVLEHSLPVEVVDSLQELVFAHVRSTAEAPGEWGVRMRMELAEPPVYSVSRREYCPPRPRDPKLESSMREFISTGTRISGGVRERTVLLHVRVHPAGYVTEATVARGAPSGGTLERDLATYIRRFSFHPATIDGVPVHGELQVPVRVPG